MTYERRFGRWLGAVAGGGVLILLAVVAPARAEGETPVSRPSAPLASPSVRNPAEHDVELGEAEHEAV